jgi:hypothetical protein
MEGHILLSTWWILMKSMALESRKQALSKCVDVKVSVMRYCHVRTQPCVVRKMMHHPLAHECATMHSRVLSPPWKGIGWALPGLFFSTLWAPTLVFSEGNRVDMPKRTYPSSLAYSCSVLVAWGTHVPLPSVSSMLSLALDLVVTLTEAPCRDMIHNNVTSK